jgi:hypothetical protein
MPMKIKQAAELTFDDLVNQPTISITRTAIQLGGKCTSRCLGRNRRESSGRERFQGGK